MSVRSKKVFFPIFQNFQIFFGKRPQGDLGNIERKKVMKYELIGGAVKKK